ncbi:MAG: hypothetical protein HQL66_12955 [Magnetococcales bacterium]|nr:hypothetical protein [Magnetococcales bacterium]
MLNAIPGTFVHGATLPLQEHTNLQVAVQQVRTNNAEQLEPRYVPGAAATQAYQPPEQKVVVTWQQQPRQQDAGGSSRGQQRNATSAPPPVEQGVAIPADEVAVLASPAFPVRYSVRSIPAVLRQYRKNARQTRDEASDAREEPRASVSVQA